MKGSENETRKVLTELRGCLTAHIHTYNICTQSMVIINADAPFLCWVDHPG